MHKNPIRNGFTLLEISIVVVIIALIAGGVLVGRDLLAAASIRSLVSQQQQLQAATLAFATKYHCLPGDCESGEALGFTTQANRPITGDNNGMIGHVGGSLFAEGDSTGLERTFFWEQISQSGLWPHPFFYEYSGNNGGLPAGGGPMTNLRQTQWWVSYTPAMDGGNFFGLFGQLAACGFFTCGGALFSEALTPGEAFSLDEKLDDGMPMTGNVVAGASANDFYTPPFGGGMAPPNGCVTNNTASDTYLPAKDYNRQHCNLLIRMQAVP